VVTVVVVATQCGNRQWWHCFALVVTLVTCDSEAVVTAMTVMTVSGDSGMTVVLIVTVPVAPVVMVTVLETLRWQQ
jgi:hypothetical protein